MAIALYRDGDTHVVRGVTCEMGLFEVNEMDHALSVGWRKSPEVVVELPYDGLTGVERYFRTKFGEDVIANGLDTMKLDELKSEADKIGVTYPGNILEKTLREKIRKALSE